MAQIIKQPAGEFIERLEVVEGFLAEMQMGQDFNQMFETGGNEIAPVDGIISYKQAERGLARHTLPEIAFSHGEFIEVADKFRRILSPDIHPSSSTSRFG